MTREGFGLRCELKVSGLWMLKRSTCIFLFRTKEALRCIGFDGQDFAIL